MHVYQSLLRCKIMYRTQKTKKKVFTQYGTMFFVFGSKYHYLCCISVFSIKILQRVLGFPTFYGLSPFCTSISSCYLKKKGFNQPFRTRHSNQKVRFTSYKQTIYNSMKYRNKSIHSHFNSQMIIYF